MGAYACIDMYVRCALRVCLYAWAGGRARCIHTCTTHLDLPLTWLWDSVTPTGIRVDLPYKNWIQGHRSHTNQRVLVLRDTGGVTRRQCMCCGRFPSSPQGRASQERPGHTQGWDLALQPKLMGIGLPVGRVLV